MAFAVPPVLFVLVPAGSEPDLSPRHLFYGLPLWAAAIGVGVVWLRRWIPERAWLVVVAGVIVLAVASPASGLKDPRELGLLPTETPATVQADAGDLLFPYATPFLAELGSVREALALPQGPGDQILRTLEHADEPIRAVHVALPREEWEVVTLRGPFDKERALQAAAETIATARHPPELDWWYELVERGLRTRSPLHCRAVAGERIKLEVAEREGRGSSDSRRLRRSGMIPGVLYGRGKTPHAICVHERELRRVLTGPSGLHAILDVVLEGQKTTHASILKDYQQDVITGRIAHIDLQEVRLDQPIQAQVVIELVGESVGTKEGGVLSQVSREINVEALPMEIPERIEVDISEMRIGDTLRLADVGRQEGVTFLDDPEETVLATVTVPTQIVEPEPEEEELEEGEELAEGEEPPEGAAEGEEPSAEADSGEGGEPETTEG